MQQKYKVLSFAIVTALYIFLVPSPSHAQTHVPNTFAGDKACLGDAWTLGCDRIPLNGEPHAWVDGERQDALREACERLEMTKPAYWSHTTYDIIQATGGYCYYYKDGKSSGRGGPNMWSYTAPPRPSAAECTKVNQKERVWEWYFGVYGWSREKTIKLHRECTTWHPIPGGYRYGG